MLTDTGLFDATVPVFKHYLQRIDAIITGISEEQESKLEHRLAPQAFSAAEHFQTAIDFVPRTIEPLIGRGMPQPVSELIAPQNLKNGIEEVITYLCTCEVTEFEGISDKNIKHTAGDAELVHDATTYVTIFALPNFFFHLVSAYSILRNQGIDIGKSDYDGMHKYKAGFHFST